MRHLCVYAACLLMLVGAAMTMPVSAAPIQPTPQPTPLTHNVDQEQIDIYFACIRGYASRHPVDNIKPREAQLLTEYCNQVALKYGGK